MDYVGLLLIFCARIVDVSCGTVRILFLVRGRRALAAMIGFVEVMIYLTALGHIIGGGREMNWIQMVVYCAGFSTGNFIGSLLEEKLMNAYVFLELIMDRTAETKEMIDNIRADGFGATVIYGRGRDGVRTIVHHVAIGIDARDMVFLISFEAPEDEWQALDPIARELFGQFLLE